MPVSYEKNKKHIYNYVNNNRDKYNEYMNEYRKANLEKVNKYNLDLYYYKKSISYECEVKRLMSIRI
jgi:hypothetical protein